MYLCSSLIKFVILLRDVAAIASHVPSLHDCHIVQKYSCPEFRRGLESC